MTKQIKNKMMSVGRAMLMRHNFVSRSHLPIDMNGTSINDDRIPKMKPPMLAKLSIYGNKPRTTVQGRWLMWWPYSILPSNTMILMSNLTSSNQGWLINRHDCSNSTSWTPSSPYKAPAGPTCDISLTTAQCYKRWLYPNRIRIKNTASQISSNPWQHVD